MEDGRHTGFTRKKSTTAAFEVSLYSSIIATRHPAHAYILLCGDAAAAAAADDDDGDGSETSTFVVENSK